MSGWSRAGLEMTPWLAILLTCCHHAPLFFLSKKSWMCQMFPAGSKSTLGWVRHLWDALRSWFVKVNASQKHRASTHVLEAHSGPSAWKPGLPARGTRKAEVGRRSQWLVVVVTQPVPHAPRAWHRRWAVSLSVVWRR